MKRIASGMVLTLLLTLVIFSIQPPEASGAVGIKVGDWIVYDYAVTGAPPGTNLPKWMKVEFLSVEGTNATILVTMHMSDGTEQNQTMTVDLIAGGGTLGTFSGLVIPANSTTGDAIYINGFGYVNIGRACECTRPYAGAGRTVVCTRFSQHGTQLMYYWDKLTGIMVEASAISGVVTGTVRAAETNMWESTSYMLPVHNVDAGLDYATIQEAIDSASFGDTIFISNGTYCEHIIVNKSLTLIGEDKNAAIIDGFGAEHVVEISASNVSISGFTIKGSYRGPMLGYWYAGIYVEGTSANNTITDNIVTTNANGIQLDNTANNTITDNIIKDNGYWYETSGIYVKNSSYNNIGNNHITGNGGKGIHIEEGAHNNLSNNIVENNTPNGVYLFRSIYNNITNNTVKSNELGMRIFHAPYNLFRSNAMYNNDYNFGIHVMDTEDSVQDIDTSNTVQGRPVYYLLNQSNLIVEPSRFPEIGYLAIMGGKNVTLRNLTLTKNEQGLLLYNVSNSVIENVSISHNYGGIIAMDSNNNTLKACTITNNKFISVDGHNNTIDGNAISNHGEVRLRANEYHGGWIVEVPEGAIAISGDNNSIFHNNFINNLGSLAISGDNNTSDNGYPSGGNYWSDYDGEDTDEDGLGDTPYVIDLNYQDRYPLMNPFVYHEYDLAVSLKMSHYYLTHGTSSILEATVYNLGLSNENDVKLDLLIDNDVVDSIVIPELPSSSTYKHVLNYTWSPTVGDRDCNFTVFAVPRPDEKITVNNVAITSVLVCHRHDVAIVNVVPQEKQIIVEPRQIVNIDVTIKNNGTATENVGVRLGAAGKWKEMIISNLAPTAETIATLSLNTTEMIRGINNSIFIKIRLPDRIFPFNEYIGDLMNNHYVFKMMVMPIDLNGDRAVNIVDIAIVAKAFGTEPGDKNWNLIADINEDGVINFLDISEVAEDFGKNY